MHAVSKIVTSPKGTQTPLADLIDRSSEILPFPGAFIKPLMSLARSRGVEFKDVNNLVTKNSPIIHQLSGAVEKHSDELGELKSPAAFECLYDNRRTASFLRAVSVGVKRFERQEWSKGNRNAPIQVLGAGCGPLPVLEVAAALASPNVEVTCLEINATSAELARNVIKNLGLSSRIKVLTVDATAYNHLHATGLRPDLIVTETMTSGLSGESMTRVIKNLAPQLSPNGLLIPEEIRLNIVVKKEFEADNQGFRRLRSSEPFYVLNKNSYLDSCSFEVNLERYSLPDGFYRLSISTKIDLLTLANGKTISLKPKQSTITDDILVDLFAVSRGKAPKFEIKFTPSSSNSLVTTKHLAA